MKVKNSILLLFGLAACMAVFQSCASIPDRAKAVENFEIERYMGTWYEMARLDFSFERNLDNVSAQYRLKKNGDVQVLNSGYNAKKRKWKKAEGVAKFRGDSSVAEMKVSFFGPFYAGYNVLAVDQDYQYALVAGRNLDYLWVLSRTKQLPESVKAKYLNIATSVGYDTSKLIWVTHDRSDNPFLNEG